MKHILKNIFILWMLMIAGSIAAQEVTVTEEQVTQIYVATFDRAPDADGLKYWVNSGLTIEEIAESFFAQPETQKKYPEGMPAKLFIKTVYQNMFNRQPKNAGLKYWAKALEEGRVSREQFILALVRGAQDTGVGKDKRILANKTAVGLYFAEQGLNDLNLAKKVMQHVTASSSSLKRAKRKIDQQINPTYPVKPTEPALNFPDITRVSVASDGTQGDDNSYEPSISSDGRYVAFYSDASNLVAGDTNGEGDVFVHDRVTGETTRVSVASDGTQGDSYSSHPFISSDGRYVAFKSGTTNLVDGDTNAKEDVFVHDRVTGETTRVSVASDGTQGDGNSYRPSISSDGHYVAFYSSATNLVAGDTNWEGDIFVHDRLTGETVRVSVASDGTQGDHESSYPSISSDGRYVAFYSDASSLVAGDTNGEGDVFVHDRLTGETVRVSVASDGTQGDHESSYPSISSDGRYVAFNSSATNLVAGDTNGRSDIFVHDRLTGETTRVSTASDGTQGDSYSYEPSISSDGRYVAFYSDASNLVAGDTNGEGDVFVHDRVTGETTMVSVASDGAQSDDGSSETSISSDGRYVAFFSNATNLVAGDTNGKEDVFVSKNEQR